MCASIIWPTGVFETILDWFVSLSLAYELKGRGKGKVTGGAEVSNSFPTSGSKSGAGEQVRQYCFTFYTTVTSHIKPFLYTSFYLSSV